MIFMVLFAGTCSALQMTDTIAFYDHFGITMVQAFRSAIYEPVHVSRTEELSRTEGSVLIYGMPERITGGVNQLLPVTILFLLLCLIPFRSFYRRVQCRGVPLSLCDTMSRYLHRKDGKKCISARQSE